MKAEALTLSATLNSSEVDFYTIPLYQRPYTWKPDEYETLWRDLQDAYTAYRKAKDGGSDPEYYFLGPVVFVRNKPKRSFDIIDGQQRLTTFHILLWNLSRRLTDETEKNRINAILSLFGQGVEPKLKVSGRDASTYIQIRSVDADIPGDTLMVQAANYFRKEVATLANPEDFSQFLRDYTQFIMIVADDYNRAWDLFIGINAKGVPLNPTDLVKAYICGNSDVGDQIGDVWENQIHPLGDSSTQFLLMLARYKLSKFATEHGLFKEFSRAFPSKISTVDVTTFSNVFRLFWLTPIEEIENDFSTAIGFTEKGKKYLRLLRYLRRRDITTLVFKFAEAYGLDSIFKEDFLLLNASFQIRMATASKRSKERRIVTEYAETIFPNDNKKKALDSILAYYKSEAPDDVFFKELISRLLYGNYAGRCILQAHEEGTRGMRSIESFELEHLMPQTGTGYWFGKAGTSDPSEYEKIINSIGNLFVLDRLSNNQIKNQEFSVKKDFYQREVSGWSVAQITASKTEWTPTDIKDRTEAIAKWAIKQWPLTF